MKKNKIKHFMTFLTNNQVVWIYKHKSFNSHYYFRKCLNEYIKEYESIKKEFNETTK